MKKKKLFWKSIGYSLSLIYKSNKITFIIYLLISLILATCPLLSIYYLKNILNEVSNDNIRINDLYLYIALFIIITILNKIFSSIENLLKTIIRSKASYQFDLMVVKKVVDLPMSFLDSSSGRNLVDDLTYSRNTVLNMANYIFIIIFSTYTFIIAFLTLIQFNIIFSFLFLLLTIPGTISQVIIGRRIDIFRRKSAPDVRKFSYYRWMLTDSWPAKDVRMYDLTNSIKGRYDQEKDNYRRANKRLDFKKLKTSVITELIKRSGEIAFTIFVIVQALNNQISIGYIALYIGFALSATQSFQEITYLSISLYYVGTKSLEGLFDFFELEADYQTESIRPLEEFKSLTFDNVYFKYPSSNKEVLKGVSFTLKKGDKLSIIGINGSGKTTIVKLILGLYKQQSGQILINGFPITDYDIKDVRKMFSVLFQNFVQYPLTLRDNIILSDINRINNDEEIIESLKLSGIYDVYEKLEMGLDSMMSRRFDDKGVELSKGQWQKIALSRAYFKNAPVLIFDEPSSALDAEAEDKIFNQFEEISQSKTGVMISHRISSARLSNVIIVLDDGKIVENGVHDDLVKQNGIYAKLYNLQLQKYSLKEEITHE